MSTTASQDAEKINWNEVKFRASSWGNLMGSLIINF